MNSPAPGQGAVLLGAETYAVAVARRLGKAGVPVHMLGSEARFGAHSRYCTSFANLGYAAGASGRWLDWLRRKGPRGAALLPCMDAGAELVARHREELRELGYVPAEGNDEVTLAMLDKERTYELAREIGVSVPRTLALRTSAEVDRAVEEMTYPCILKPLHSHMFQWHFGDRKVVLVSDGTELRESMMRLRALSLETMASEIVPGGDDQLWGYGGYLDENGEALDGYMWHKIRQWPVGFGVSCYGVSAWDPEVAEVSLRFARGVGLQGVFVLELKRDPRDGELKLIECNPRYTIQLLFSARDIPLLAYNRLAGLPLPPAGEFKTGVYQWNPAKDVRAFRVYRGRGELSVLGWLRSLLHRQRFHLFRWDDPMPTIHFHARVIGIKLRNRLRRRPSGALTEEERYLRARMP